MVTKKNKETQVPEIESNQDALQQSEENIEKKEEELKGAGMPEVQDWVKRKNDRLRQEQVDKIEKIRKKANKIKKENIEKIEEEKRWNAVIKTSTGGVIEWRKGGGVISGYVKGKPFFSVKQGAYQFTLYSEDGALTKKLGNKYIGVEVSIERLKQRAEDVLKDRKK